MNTRYNKEISKEDLEALPLEAFQGEIICIESPEEADKAAEILSRETVLGFDTETKPAFRRGQRHGIALLQLSTLDTAYLFRLNKFRMTESVAAILADPDIIKAGAAVKDDISGLQRLCPFKAAGFVELQKLSIKYGIENNALKKMAGIVLGFRISKSAQLSNWEDSRLSETQKRYAATDAWVGLLIYRGLVYGEKYRLNQNH